MTKSELIKLLSSKNIELGSKNIGKIIDIIFEEFSKALVESKRIEIRRFGALSTRKRSSRTARNLSTNKVIEISERVVPYFRMGKELREKLNGKEE